MASRLAVALLEARGAWGRLGVAVAALAGAGAGAGWWQFRATPIVLPKTDYLN